jgi:hypothetical protein
MARHDIHLVGSVPLATAAEVFDTLGSALGPALLRMPDGETGDRRSWLGWLEPVFSTHPDFERTSEINRSNARGQPTFRYRLRAGVSARDVHFHNLAHASYARESYRVFAERKQKGRIPGRVRFMFPMANPVSVIDRFLKPEHRDEIEPRYEDALRAQIDEMVAEIPRDQLAIQWDIASAVFDPLERNEPGRFGATKEEAIRNFSQRFVRHGGWIPEDVDLIYHLCYGDFGHRHTIDPSSTEDMVAIANAISRDIGRSVQLFHMPVPRHRGDDAYFKPLERLRLRPETRLSLGLIHHTDGVEGARRRIAAATRYVSDFLVATECGFGRRPVETIPELLRIHAEVAGI